MADEPRGGVARFFCYLNLFCFFMLMLVLGNNFLVMFVGWKASVSVHICSSATGEKKSASDAGKKAFITNRVGDWGFVLGVFLIYSTFGTFDFRAVQNAAATMPVGQRTSACSFICLFSSSAQPARALNPALCLAAGRDGGPTPVSAPFTRRRWSRRVHNWAATRCSSRTPRR
jgi:NADH-quinone oxidoreductase subunit L